MTVCRSKRLSLDPADWPEVDQQLWAAARRQGNVLDEVGAAAHWRPKTARQAEKGYGLWLGYLARTGHPESDTLPATRASKENLRGYVGELKDRVSSVTVASRVRDVREALRVMQPNVDLSMLTKVLRRLEARAKPNRNKGARIVSSQRLFEAGLDHIRQSMEEPAPSEHIRAARIRNGLLIAFLAACPVRLANLATTSFDRHLVPTRDGYLCRWGASETKEGRPREFELPDALVPYMNQYLASYRLALLGPNISNRIWISVRRRPMSEQAIYDQVTKTTERIFGRSINPHLFRDCLTTSIATDLPDRFRIASSILGHASLETTRRYYDHARMIEAVRRSNAVIIALRAQFRREEASNE